MKLSNHNLSSSNLWTSKLGRLQPIHVMEVLPRDKVTFTCKNFVRFSPLVAPMMSNVFNYTHSWYVPTWLVWDDFEKMITGANEGLKVPQVAWHPKCKIGTLWDAFGLPVVPDGKSLSNFKISALPFKAFWFIWDVYYRDEDLQPNSSYEEMEPLIDKWIKGTASADDIARVIDLPYVSWRKDIYTTARPWQQKGSEVSIPLDLDITAKGPMMFYTQSDNRATGIKAVNVRALNMPVINNTAQITPDEPFIYGRGLQIEHNGASLTINKLALASALARRRYKDGRIGSRYAELLNSFGASSADARLFIPQYLGGSKELMQISEVVQTSQSTTTSNLGDMGGHGIGVNKSRPFRRQYSEHGIQITLSFFRPDAVYMNSTPRWWFSQTREDFYFPEFEGIGLQEILTRELSPYADADAIFGWNDAYYYYRQHVSQVTGEFRTLDKHWHLARDFGDQIPALNSSFIECKPSNRVFADLVNDQLKVTTNFIVKARRMVKKTARLKL